MTKKKLFITLAVIILIGGAVLSTRDNIKINIQPNMIQQITIAEMGTGAKRKVLLPPNDIQTIKKIVGLLNSSNSVKKSTSKELGYRGLMGISIYLTIKLKDGTTMDFFPMLIWTEVFVPNGRAFTGNGIPDQTIIRVDQNGKSTHYSVKSKLLADYVSQGSNVDIPRISN